MKKRIRRCDPGRQGQWQAVIRRWEQSGQSVRVFCRAEGVRESAFYFWRRELVRCGHRVDAGSGLPSRASGHRVDTGSGVLHQASPEASVMRSSSPVSPRHSRTAAFLPVHVVEPSVSEAACGRTVRVPARFDRQTLADVLAVLETPPC
jgi:hypothetical protein